jgi:hypothetical protein
MTFGSGKRCRATGKRTGEQCKNPATANSDFCFLHNKRPVGKRGAPRGNKNNLRHGANSKILKEYKRRITGGGNIEPGYLAFNILDEEERKAFLVIVDGMCGDFSPTTPSDFYEIELLATCMILLHRATKRGNMKAVAALERMVRLGMRDLRSGKTAAQRAAGEGKTQRKITPAEWASALLKSVREEEERERAEDRSIEKMAKDESEEYTE